MPSQYLKFMDRCMQFTTQIIALLAISAAALKKPRTILLALLVLVEKLVIHQLHREGQHENIRKHIR